MKDKKLNLRGISKLNKEEMVNMNRELNLTDLEKVIGGAINPNGFQFDNLFTKRSYTGLDVKSHISTTTMDDIFKPLNLRPLDYLTTLLNTNKNTYQHKKEEFYKISNDPKYTIEYKNGLLKEVNYWKGEYDKVSEIIREKK